MLKVSRYELLVKGILLLVFCLPSQAAPTVLGIKRNLSNPSAIRSAAGQSSSKKKRDNSTTTEEFSFLIKDFKINHQSEMNNLNLTVRYRYAGGIAESAYPDFRLIAKDTENALATYPNKTDYWEIVNKRLTWMILDRYPVIQSVTTEMQVSPTPGDPYTRTSTVTRSRGAAFMKKAR
jgi:hypothetical protein